MPDPQEPTCQALAATRSRTMAKALLETSQQRFEQSILMPVVAKVTCDHRESFGLWVHECCLATERLHSH